MSGSGTQTTIARRRAGVIDEASVRARLADVKDPELPMVSILELGMVGAVEVGSVIRVEILPTYVGCPALAIIEGLVADRLADLGRPVTVVPTFTPPWTSERISHDGLVALAGVGIAPPVEPAAMRCPWCGSDAVVADSLFGPTQCRALWYCRGCRQPFEAIKQT